MRASALVKRYGERLIGQLVVTQPMGEWPGGVARVLDLGHDPAAPEIVMNVERGGDPIGVFAYEQVELLKGRKLPDHVKRNFEVLRQAVNANRALIADCYDRKEGRHVVLVCAVNQDGKEVEMVPLAMMLNDQEPAYGRFIPTTEYGDLPKPKRKKTSKKGG